MLLDAKVYGGLVLNLENKKFGIFRTLIGCLLGLVLALFSPAILFSELFSLMLVIVLPALGLMLLYRFTGRIPAILSSTLLLAFSARMLGSSFMWMMLFAAVMPTALLLYCERKPFYTQMKVTILAFGVGMVLSILVMYINYGGNLIERVLLAIPKLMRQLPEEITAVARESYAAMQGKSLTAEEFYQLYEQMINVSIPVYQMNLPGVLFGGVLVSAVGCVGLNSWILHKHNNAAEGAFLPLQAWALPASATGGLLLISAVSLIMYLAGMANGEELFCTVYNIAAVAFCIQAMASIARYMEKSSLKRGTKLAILIGVAVLCLLRAWLYLAIYGCASALFGRYGAVRANAADGSNQK